MIDGDSLLGVDVLLTASCQTIKPTPETRENRRHVQVCSLS